MVNDSTQTIIYTHRLTKTFGHFVAVNDLNLQVMRGDVFGFLGPNGSGKTTTIRMLLGLIRPTAGRAILFGMDNAYQLPLILQKIGAIVETPTFYLYLSEKDNLKVMAANFSVLFRVIGGELYKIRRRTMSKILGVIAIAAMILTFCVLAIPIFYAISQSASSYLPLQRNGAADRYVEHNKQQEM